MFEQDNQKKIISIQFGLLSPEEIRRGSVVHVLHPETVENGIPKENGLIDLRMGTTERNFLCQTCNSSSFECIGHYGHIELSRPMFHIGYMSKIKKVLESVCFYCSKIKAPKRMLGRGLEESWTVLKNRSVCEGEETPGGKTGCGNKQPAIKKDGLNLIAFMKEDEDGEGRVVLNGERVHGILKKIGEEDMRFLGFDPENCRPEWMVVTTVVVPPPAVRPSIVLNGHLRAEDDITHKLADIVKANGYLKKYEQEGAPSHIVRDYEQLLQFHLATLIDNDIGGQPQALQKNGRPLKSISARLKGKEGRIRGNLMGKRVDFSARSVISPDPCISVGEVGVPQHVAKVQTFPEKVNSFNIEWLQQLVNRGPNEYPGANYVIRTDGQRIDLNFNRFDLKLERGFIVERHMQNNDEVLFNRQPSLHKMSMMGHRARIVADKSFRLNLSATTPYNADFDGDEMNLHMPQSYTTKAELGFLAAVEKQIISPQSNRPVIGIIQDTLMGVLLLTARDTFFNRREAMALLYSIDCFAKKNEDFADYLRPAIISPVELWTGKQLFSSILPRIFYSRSNNNDSDKKQNGNGKANFVNNIGDNHVLVLNGHLLTGAIDKRAVGAQQGGFIHIIFNDFGPSVARQFIDNIQRIVNHFLLHISSFSVGIGDCIADPATYRLCRSTVHSAISEVDQIIAQTKRNELDKLPGMSLMETFESKVNMVLNKARNVSGTSAQNSLNSQNNMKAMVVSGSKGNYINISQITTCLGQQNVEGRRVPFGFVERSLPHFYKYDFAARSRGFVQNSYLSGMSPDEFFFHAMGGREGIIDTAIKTAETGYIQRRLVKALEDATVHHDFSVRNGNGDIYQFAYGDDGFDATHLENVTVPLDGFKERYFIDMFGDEAYAISPTQVSPDVYQLLSDDLELQKLLDKEYEYLYRNQGLLKGTYASPVNIARILKKYQSGTDSTISPYVIFSMLDSVMTGNPKLDYYIRISLNVRFVLLNLNLNSFTAVLNQIRIRILKARINANEMVGTIAAQSVGEPATQMTLNTFHLAGVASTVSMGVPRLNEIINLSRSIKTPSMQIFLAPNLAQNIDNARLIQSQVEYLSLKAVCESSQILYDPDVTSTTLPQDSALVESYFAMPDEDIDFSVLGKFVVRFVLSRSILVSRGLSLDFIASKIRGIYDDAHIITSDENDPTPVIRVRFLPRDTLAFYAEAQAAILKIHLQGYSNIKKAYLSESNSEWCIHTDGINFLPILSAPGIDGARVIANDIYTIYSILGIEAARQAIFNEIEFVIENNGSYVNGRHIALLADVMTVRGYLTGITRHGVSRESASALKRASFEETVDVLLEAAANAELDATRGVSENIMLGQLPPVGTGSVDIVLDIKKLDHIVPHRIPVARDSHMSPLHSPSSDSVLSAWSSGNYSPIGGGFSPIGTFSPGFSPDLGSYGASPSPHYSPSSMPYAARSPTYKPTSQGFNPLSPTYSPVSTSYQPGGNAYNPTSVAYSPKSNYYDPTSTVYRPTSTAYRPTSPTYFPTSTAYSPMSPGYSGSHDTVTSRYNPSEGTYSPMSPTYSPQSPSFVEKKKEEEKK